MRDRRRGETREKSPWTRARKLADDAPDTRIDPTLRALCLQGEKALSVRIAHGGDVEAYLGTPLDAEEWTAWRHESISVYLHGDVPKRICLGLGAAARVTADVSWASP